MTDSIDTVDWASLRHAHGPADDVPRLLRSLLSDDRDVRTQACAELHETVWHQGTVYPASAAVVPILFELLNHPGLNDPGCVVSLIGCVATGEGWVQYGLRVDGEPSVRMRLAGRGRSLEEELSEERATMESIHRGVSPGLRLLLPYLHDREGLAPLVAETLGRFPEHADWLVPAINDVLATVPDRELRQVLAASKASLESSQR